MKTEYIIRRTHNNGHYTSSSYIVPRSFPRKRSIAGQYRFAKISTNHALNFKNLKDARRVLSSIKRTTYTDRSMYKIVER